MEGLERLEVFHYGKLLLVFTAHRVVAAEQVFRIAWGDDKPHAKKQQTKANGYVNHECDICYARGK